MWYIKNQNELYHHGILGQKWGKRNGPPYPLGGGDYSEPEKRAIYRERQKRSNSIYNKKHFDEVLKKGTTLSTLSHDPNRTKGKDMFYAAHTKLDKHEYNVVLNKAVPKTIYDENGQPLGTGTYHKWRINNSVSSDLKVASEDSGAEQFRQLFKKDRDFYNFVTDPSRMESHIPKRQFRFKGYREAMAALEKLRKGGTPTSEELQTIYRLYNYTIPSDGLGDHRRAKDVATQRAKFFGALKQAGYSAVLDTNDAIYNDVRATSPVIVFDESKFIPSGIELTSGVSKIGSALILAGRKALGV